jgi:LacI family transcriptional regulator
MCENFTLRQVYDIWSFLGVSAMTELSDISTGAGGGGGLGTIGPANVLERAKVYNTIKLRLQRQLGRRWPVGGRLPPIKELARQLKTGQTNTHRAVKELVRDGLLVSRSGQGTFVTDRIEPKGPGDEPAEVSTASARPTAPIGTIAGAAVQMLLASMHPDLFLRKAVDAFRAALTAEGCRVNMDVYTQQNQTPLAAHSDADALLIVNPSGVNLTAAPKQALVVINTALETFVGRSTGYDVVTVDSEQGGLLVGEYFRRGGLDPVCFIGCPPHDGTVAEYDHTSAARIHGFELGLGRKLAPQHRMTCTHYHGVAAAQRVPDYLRLNPRPQGIFAASDEIALGFMHGAAAHGLEPGKDYQIIGFDSQQRGRELPTPLTSVEVPSVDMGALAARLLIERMLDPQRAPRRILLGCSLWAGKTTQPLPVEPEESDE